MVSRVRYESLLIPKSVLVSSRFCFLVGLLVWNKFPRKLCRVSTTTSCISCTNASARNSSYHAPHSPCSSHTVYLLPSPITSGAMVTLSGCSDGSGFGDLTVSRGASVASVITSYKCSGNITRASGSIFS